MVIYLVFATVDSFVHNRINIFLQNVCQLHKKNNYIYKYITFPSTYLCIINSLLFSPQLLIFLYFKKTTGDPWKKKSYFAFLLVWKSLLGGGDISFKGSIVIIKSLSNDAGRKSPLTDFEFIFEKITRKIMFENWMFLLSVKTTGPYLENKNL